MSLYDNPLPPADYAAYRALREEMCDLALPYLGHCLERQQTLREVGGISNPSTLTQQPPALVKPSAACNSSVTETMAAGNGRGTIRRVPTRQKPCATPCASKPGASSTASNG